MTTTRQLHLNVNALNAGVFGGSWRHPDHDPLSSYGLDHYRGIASKAEEAKLDAIFLADGPVIGEDLRHRSANSLEPTTVLADLASRTERLGLIGTLSSTYNDPFELARRLLSLDLVSGGRVGWNVVTTAGAAAAQNFGFDAEPDHEGRYDRAARVVRDVVTLWEGGSVDGRSLGLPRSAQGSPVVVQAGGSADGTRLASRIAEVIFSAAQTLDGALSFASRVREGAASFGRGADDITILPGLSTVLGSTEREAAERRDLLDELLPLDYALDRLSGQLGLPLRDFDLDSPLPVDRLAVPTAAGGSQTFFAEVVGIIRRENPTLRRLLSRLGGGAGHRIVVGTPEQVADDIERWFVAGAADGFNLMPDVLPSGLDDFADHVVPILQDRGLFRREYEGTTLRSHLGRGATAAPGSAAPSLVGDAVDRLHRSAELGGDVLVPDDALDPTVLVPLVSSAHPATRFVVEADSAVNAPYNLARRILSLHRGTPGGVALRLRATGVDEVSRRAGGEEADASEFVAVLQDLWRSFPQGALVGDQAAGAFADVSAIRPIDHVGGTYRVRGPLNVPSDPAAPPEVQVVVDATAAAVPA